MDRSSVAGGTTVRKSASITIVEEPDDIEQHQDEQPLQPPETYIPTFVTETATSSTTRTAATTISTTGPPRDYYNSGSTEDATDTAVVINRLEAVRVYLISSCDFLL
jgi:hypothetical protein